MFVLAMRYERLSDVECFNKHLPGWVVDTEHRLMLLDAVLPLRGDAMWIRWYCSGVSTQINPQDVLQTY
jgi:hypothetical protein